MTAAALTTVPPLISEVVVTAAATAWPAQALVAAELLRRAHPARRHGGRRGYPQRCQLPHRLGRLVNRCPTRATDPAAGRTLLGRTALLPYPPGSTPHPPLTTGRTT